MSARSSAAGDVGDDEDGECDQSTLHVDLHTIRTFGGGMLSQVVAHRLEREALVHAVDRQFAIVLSSEGLPRHNHLHGVLLYEGVIATGRFPTQSYMLE